MLVVALVAMFGYSGAMAQDSDPIITLKTNLYESLGANNSGAIKIAGFSEDWIDVDCGAGTEEHELVKMTYDSEAGTQALFYLAMWIGLASFASTAMPPTFNISTSAVAMCAK